jgi:hypothetical protein
MLRKEASLRPRQIVLRKLGNLLEEMRPLFVVEEPGGERLWRAGKPRPHLGGDSICR